MGLKHLWINLGDVNWLEHGGFFIKADADDDSCFFIIEVTEGFNTDYIIQTGYVDISDSWINWEDVYSYFGGGREDRMDGFDQAQAAFNYYGYTEFNGEFIAGSKATLMLVLEENEVDYKKF